MRIREKEHVDVRVGDVVEAYFDHCSKPEDRGPIRYRVTDVQRRYGLLNGGRTPQAPLLTVVNMDGMNGGVARSYFCNSFVTKIVERSQQTVVTNIFRGRRSHLDVKVDGNLWTGSLLQMTALALSKLPYELDRSIEMNRLQLLYTKQMIGCKRVFQPGVHFFTVDRRRFEKWVRKNHSRITMTIPEMVQMETRHEMSWESEMDHDYMDLDDQDNMSEESDYDYAERDYPV